MTEQGKDQPSPFEIIGRLPDWAIKECIRAGIIEIDPLVSNWEDLVGPVSIDFRLGRTIRLFRPEQYEYINTKKPIDPESIQEIYLEEGEPYILGPQSFVNATTLERLKLPDNIEGRLDGKSSLGRLGIVVHSTAGRFDPGWDGIPTLELGNIGQRPAILYCGMRVCCFSFERLPWPVESPYGSKPTHKYFGQKGAETSRIHQEFQRKQESS